MLRRVASYLDALQAPAGSYKHRVILVALASILVVVTSGVALNWSALVVILKGEGVYRDLCVQTQNNTVDCRPQDVRLNLAFTLSVAAIFTTAPIFGFILDSKGSRTILFLGSSIYLLGVLFYFLSSANGLDLFFLGQILMNTGGPVTWQGVMIFANLIPDKMPTISTILNTAYDASMIVWTIFNLLFTTLGIAHNVMFLALLVFVGCLSFYLIARWPIGLGKNASFADLIDSFSSTPKTETPKDNIPLEEVNMSGSGEITVDVDEAGSGASAPAAAETEVKLDDEEEKKTEEAENSTSTSLPDAVFADKTFVQQLQLPEYMLFAAYHVCYASWQMIYFGTVERRIAFLVDESDVAYYVSMFGWILSAYFLVSPFIGRYIERVGLVNTYLTVHATLLIWCLILLSSDIRLQVLGFAVFGLCRAIYWSILFVYIQVIFGFGNYGRLYGIMQFIVGVISFVQNPLTSWVLNTFNGDWTTTNYIMASNFLALSIFPIFLYRGRTKYEQVKVEAS